ncbi:MAG: cyclic nucleotide-binding domain-containing protein [Bdellovibrionales bacterium]|nr:cyclic nucleotide-binding domain-containing protein [Bdellovibrionales bacterium]
MEKNAGEWIRRAWLLADLMPDEVLELSRVSSFMDLIANSQILTRGATNHALWIVVRGTVNVVTDEASPKMVATLGEGDLLGEMSWLDGLPASATAVVSEPSKVLRILFSDFDSFLGRNSEAHIQILRKFAINLSHRLRGT